MNQFDLEKWWVDYHRSNGLGYAQRLRNSGRISSDPSLRKLLNRSAHTLLKRASVEMFTPRGSNGLVSESGTYILKILESMEGLALTHLVLSAGLNHLVSKRANETTLPAVGSALARAVELELRIRYIEKVMPELADAHKRAGGTFVHKNRALMAVAGRSGLPDFFANRHTRQKVETALVELMLLATNVFEPYLAWRGKSSIWSVRVRPEVLDRLNRAGNLDEFLSTVPPLGLYLDPQPIRPRDGYVLPRRPLVSYNWLSGQSSPEEPPRLVVGCLDHLNSVGYRINTEMLAWIRTHEATLAGRGIIPPVEFRMRESDDRAQVYRDWHSRESVARRRMYARTLLLADHMADRVFFHDWFIDFRGRMYTTSPFLSPQGNPLNKSLIEFDQKVTITLRSPEWEEFLDYGLRMAFGKSMPERPLRDIFYLAERAVRGDLEPDQLDDTKDYLPFVRWSLDYMWLIKGEPVTTGIILRRDATASSIQHMSTMARDTELMERVNLVPYDTDHVSDLYDSLAVGGLGRAPLKSFIMTWCYNSTAYGRAKERLERGEDGNLSDFMKQDAAVRRELEPMLRYVAAVRDEIGRLGSENDWRFKTPSGIFWDGTRYEWPSRQILIRFTGAKMRIRLRTPDGKPDVNRTKTVAGFVANVIHSLDASMLQLCADDWPVSVAFIHDCVCTLPGQMDETVGALRHSFFMMHKKLNQEFNNWGLAETADLDYDKYINKSKFMFI